MENIRHRPTVDAAATAKKQNENEITAAYVIACIKHHSGCSRSVRYPNGNLNEIRRVCALLVVGCLSHAWRRVVCATKAIGAKLKFFLYSFPICPLPIDVCPLSVVDASHTHTSYQKSTIFFLAFASRSRPFAGWWKCVHFSSGKCSTKATRRHTKKLIDDARIHGVSARTANGENTATDLHNYLAFLETYLCTAAHSVARHTHTYTQQVATTFSWWLDGQSAGAAGDFFHFRSVVLAFQVRSDSSFSPFFSIIYVDGVRSFISGSANRWRAFIVVCYLVLCDAQCSKIFVFRIFSLSLPVPCTVSNGRLRSCVALSLFCRLSETTLYNIIVVGGDRAS